MSNARNLANKSQETTMSNISAASGVRAVPGWDAAVAKPGANQEMDKNTFLKLLVAQLQNQNVADPMDPSEVMQQTSQLTMVEKMNELVESQKASASVTRLSLASSLVGKNVSYMSGSSKLSGAVSEVRLVGDSLTLKVGSTDIAVGDVLSVS
jgi:flagellar basal-body rod modification protein FlgD